MGLFSLWEWRTNRYASNMEMSAVWLSYWQIISISTVYKVKKTLEIYTRPSVLYSSPSNSWSIRLSGQPKTRSKYLIVFIWPCTKVLARSNHSSLQFLWLIQVINMRRKAVSFQLLNYDSHRSSSLHLAWRVGRGSSAGQAHRQLHISLVLF